MRRGAGALGFAAVVAVSLSPMVAVGVDERVFVSSLGRFSNPSRPDALAIECLQYGTGEPPTFTVVGSPDPTVQSDTPGVLNQIRFGQIPEGFAGGMDRVCSQTPGDDTGLGSSGFGFRGAASAIPGGGGFELGRIIHTNRTIERGIRNVDLTTTFTFAGPEGEIELSSTLDVDLNETPDFPGVSDTSLCEFDVPENRTITVPVTATLCADEVTVTPVGPLVPAYGETELAVEVIGYARVVEGICSSENVINGSSFPTAEQQATELCILARLAEGTITVDKSVAGGPGDVFEFTLTEFDQRATPPTADDPVTIVIDATTGSGTSGRLIVEPGLYRLDESDPGPTFEAGALTCETDATAAFVTVDGIKYLDVDSNENLMCSITNTATTVTTTSTTTSTTTTTALPVTTAPSSTTPVPASTTTTTILPVRPSRDLPATGQAAPAIGTLAVIAILGGFALAFAGRAPTRR